MFQTLFSIFQSAKLFSLYICQVHMQAHLSLYVTVRARWSYSSSSVSIATRQKDRRPPPPTTHIPLHSRLCNYECCRPASPTVLQAPPGSNSWCVKGTTLTISDHGVAGLGPVAGGVGGVNLLPLHVRSERSTWKFPPSQFLCVLPGGAQNSLFLLLRRRSRGACLQMGS